MPQQKECLVVPSRTGRSRSNDERKHDTTKDIEAKVLVLEAIARRQQTPTDGLPRSMTKFREWVDPELGLKKIGSPSSTNATLSPHNEDLIGRADAAMRQIQNMLKARKLRVYVPVGTQLGQAKEALRKANEENRRLGSEALRFKHLFDVTAERLKKALADNEMHARDLNALRAEHLAATKATPRRVK